MFLFMLCPPFGGLASACSVVTPPPSWAFVAFGAQQDGPETVNQTFPLSCRCKTLGIYAPGILVYDPTGNNRIILE